MNKEQIIKDFGRKEGDTGSPEVQIALLTARINELNEHYTFQFIILSIFDCLGYQFLVT